MRLLLLVPLLVSTSAQVMGQTSESAPRPDAAAQRIGIRPERCLAVEDSETGVAAAVAAYVVSVDGPSFGAPAPEGAHRDGHSLREILEPLARDLGLA